MMTKDDHQWYSDCVLTVFLFTRPRYLFTIDYIITIDESNRR